jgi:protein-tyrosine phosphatase
MLNATVARRYTVGAVLTTAAACLLRGWWWFLMWLAVSLAAQAFAYAGRGAVVFRKHNGRLPWSVRILLAPYMICARITLHYYCRGLKPYAEAAPGVWIGRRLNRAEAQEAIAKGVTAALDLTAGFPETEPFLALTYCNIQLLPLTTPTLEQLQDAVRFIQQQSQRGIVYVHGALGYSRSVGVVAAYLLAAGRAQSVDRAVDTVRALTPQARIDYAWLVSLREFAAKLPLTRRIPTVIP